MKKSIKLAVVILSVAIGIVVLWVAARYTHVFETYNISTTSNRPTFEPNTMVYASRLKKPDYNSFVVFKQANGDVWVFRCIAKGGDMVEMRNTKVYLNGKLLYEPYAYNEYYISQKQLDSIAGYIEQYKYPVRALTDSIRTIEMTANDVKNYHLNLKLATEPKGSPDKNIFGDFQVLKYNVDNIGPIKVPENTYFLLGDDRHNAMDSRYIGFISKNDVISTVIN